MRPTIIILFLSMVALIISPSGSNAQCDADSHANACISEIQDGFTFLKKFNIDGKAGAKSKVEYSYVFSKDTQYYLNICNDGSGTDGIIVTLYNSQRQLVCTNNHKGEFNPELLFPCTTTGIYYITFTFEDSEKYCGGSVLGFNR